MLRMHKYFGALLLGAALIAPMGIQAANNFREDGYRERRYYDREHRDYHRWNHREDVRYRHWGSERHEVYRPFYKLERAQQRAYWRYRHEHPDRYDRR